MEALHAELKTLRLTESFRIAYGASSERTVLRVRCGDAVGEAPFVPYYKENPEETLRWLQSLAWSGGPAPQEGPRAGRLTLDLLWHDIVGKQRGESIGRMFQLNPDDAPRAGRSIGIPESIEDFPEKVRETYRHFPVLKLKVGSGNSDFDEAIMARAREAAPDATIFADANGGWNVADAVKLIAVAAKHGLKFVEQPLSREGGIEVWRELRAALPSHPLPLFADESAQNADDVLRLGDLVDGVNVKLLKCGNLNDARTMIRVARAGKKAVLLGCMIESSVGVTAAAHLAPLADWIDLDGHLYVANDDYDGLKFGEGGRLIVPQRPGIGVAPKGNV